MSPWVREDKPRRVGEEEGDQVRVGIDARFLTHPQAGGFKTYTVNLVRALPEVGDNCEFIVFLDREPGVDDQLPRSSRVTYRVVSGNAPWVGVPFREQVKLRTAIGASQVDLAHFLCNTAPVGLRRRYVLTLHDTIQLEGARRTPAVSVAHAAKRWGIGAYSRFAVRRAVRSAARIITVSNYARDRICSHLSVPPERVVVIPNAPDPAFVMASDDQTRAWQREFGDRVGVHGRYVLCVGYEPRKNIPLAIGAFADAARSCPDIRLIVVAADAAHRAAFDELARGLGVADRVVVLGRVSLQELVRLYNISDAFLFPSSQEGFGLPPLEAMACGTATIAMNATAIPEVVGDAGMLLDTSDQREWASAICRVMTTPDLRRELALRGQRRASGFSWHRCAQDTMAVYREACEMPA